MEWPCRQDSACAECNRQISHFALEFRNAQGVPEGGRHRFRGSERTYNVTFPPSEWHILPPARARFPRHGAHHTIPTARYLHVLCNAAPQCLAGEGVINSVCLPCPLGRVSAGGANATCAPCTVRSRANALSAACGERHALAGCLRRHIQPCMRSWMHTVSQSLLQASKAACPTPCLPAAASHTSHELTIASSFCLPQFSPHHAAACSSAWQTPRRPPHS